MKYYKINLAESTKHTDIDIREVTKLTPAAVYAVNKKDFLFCVLFGVSVFVGLVGFRLHIA